MRVRTRPALVASLIIGSLIVVSAARAQYTTASLGGSVVDSSGAVVPGANVTVQNTGTGLTKSMPSRADGRFLFPVLPVGHYRLTVETHGFTTYVQNGIVLTVNQAATQRVTLQLGAVSQQVTVSANASVLNTHTATVDQLIGQRQILDLPLNGRQAEALVFLAPGAANTTSLYCLYNCQGGAYPSTQEVSIGGGGNGNVNYEMDGAGHNDTFLNVNLPFPNPDAVQEFSVMTNNMSAAYGNSADVVNVVTKSGTNQIHGDLFEFVRNGSLNARNFFAPTQDTLKRNQFGGTIGGPIKKDKLFYFATYQGTRTRQAAAGEIAFVPTSAERQGDFSAIPTQLVNPVTGAPFPNNQIPTNLLSPVTGFYVQRMPLPNGPNGQVTFLGPELVENDDQWMSKIDYNLNKNQLSGRYFFSNFSEPPDIALAEKNILALDPCGNRVRVQTVALNDAYSASPTLLFNTWFGWDAQTGGSLSGAPPGVSLANAGASVAQPSGPPMLDGLAASGFFYISSGWQGIFDRGDKRFHEVVTLEKGAHELQFGGQLVRVNQNVNNTYEQAACYVFSNQLSGSNIVDFMLGRASSFSQSAGQYQAMLATFPSLFLNDIWKVSKKLTLDAGLRWDMYFPYADQKNRVACFHPGAQSLRYPNAPADLIFGGDPGCARGSMTYSNLANFAPRLGFALRISSKTALRGGVGIYFTQPESSQMNGSTQTAPFAPYYTLTDVDVSNPWSSAGIVNPFPALFGGVVPTPAQAVFTLPVVVEDSFPPDFHVPTMGTWNLTLDRQIGSSWLASAAYVGNLGWYLMTNQDGAENLNPAVYMPGESTEANTQQRRLYPNFSTVLLYPSDRNSNYNALELNLTKRFAHGLSIIANYAWSHQLDNFPPTNGYGTDPFDRNFDWGNSLDGVPNVFHFSEVWQAPHVGFHGMAGGLLNGWEISSTTTWQNGFPITIYSGVDNSFSAEGYDRADFIGTSLSQAILGDRPHGEMVNEYFNTSLFAPNAVGTFGSAGKDILQGPGYFETDVGLIKNTRVTERASLQFRAEFFNMFNNVNFSSSGVYGSLGTTVGTPGFGKITGANSPRILQFALKLIF
ncbi:MAG: carboxypeptidase regulatory-like domain-containing protein [Terriglobia bacterium]